jgi:hypothetical protein
MATVRNPGVAAALSALIPGIGQFYNGDFLRGIFWLIVTPGLWIGSGGTLGWIFMSSPRSRPTAAPRRKTALRRRPEAGAHLCGVVGGAAAQAGLKTPPYINTSEPKPKT